MAGMISPVQGSFHPSMKDVDVETRSVEPVRTFSLRSLIFVVLPIFLGRLYRKVQEPRLTMRTLFKSYIPHQYPGTSPYNISLPRQQSYEEEPEIALKSGPPVIELLVHIVAVGAIGVLAWASYTNVFFEDFSMVNTSWQNMRIKLWQLGAKLHELFMLASLSFIVAYYTRKLLIGRNGIPFGFLHGSGVIGSPEVLIKPRFRAGLVRNWPFGVLLIVVCAISLILGPSSAIMMIPSLGWFEFKDRIPGNSSTINYIWQTNEPWLWPTEFNGSIPFNGDLDENQGCLNNPSALNNLYCPTAGHVDVGKWFLGYIATDSTIGPVISDSYGTTKRQMSLSSSPGSQEAQSTGSTAPTKAYATVMTELMSMTLGSFWSYAAYNKIGNVQEVPVPRLHITNTTVVKQPVVHISCHTNIWNSTEDASDVSFPSPGSPWQDDTAYNNDPYVVHGDNDIFDGVPSDDIAFAWFKGDREEHNSAASLFALFVVPVNTTDAQGQPAQSSAITSCSIDARWASSEVAYQPTNSTSVISNVTDGLFREMKSMDSSTRPSDYGLSDNPLNLELEWAQFLNEEQESANDLTAMVELLSMPLDYLPVADKDGNTVTTFQVPGNLTSNPKGAYEEAIALLLGVVITDGLARSVSYSHGPWYLSDFNDTHNVYTSLPLYLMPESGAPMVIEKTELSQYYIYNVTVGIDHYGYGYNMRTTTTRWAIVCLAVYGIGVCVHILYILAALCFGRYIGGKCWNNVGDLVALAMNSAPTARLHGTSAGVRDKEIWKDVVKVRQTSGKHLELCFVQTKDEEMGAIVRNKKGYH